MALLVMDSKTADGSLNLNCDTLIVNDWSLFKGDVTIDGTLTVSNPIPVTNDYYDATGTTNQYRVSTSNFFDFQNTHTVTPVFRFVNSANATTSSILDAHEFRSNSSGNEIAMYHDTRGVIEATDNLDLIGDQVTMFSTNSQLQVGDTISLVAANTRIENFMTLASTYNVSISPSLALEDYVLHLPATVGTAGQVLSVDGYGNLGWSSPAGGSGGVDYVAVTVPAFLSIAGSPVTASGTFAIGLSGLALPITSGGTGLTSVGASGKVLTSNGTSASWQFPSEPGTGTVTSVDASVPDFLSISGNPVTTSGTLAITYSGTALPITSGGTGLTEIGAEGTFLVSDGTNASWESVSPSSSFTTQIITTDTTNPSTSASDAALKVAGGAVFGGNVLGTLKSNLLSLLTNENFGANMMIYQTGSNLPAILGGGQVNYTFSEGDVLFQTGYWLPGNSPQAPEQPYESIRGGIMIRTGTWAWSTIVSQPVLSLAIQGGDSGDQSYVGNINVLSAYDLNLMGNHFCNINAGNVMRMSARDQVDIDCPSPGGINLTSAIGAINATCGLSINLTAGGGEINLRTTDPAFGVIEIRSWAPSLLQSSNTNAIKTDCFLYILGIPIFPIVAEEGNIYIECIGVTGEFPAFIHCGSIVVDCGDFVDSLGGASFRGGQGGTQIGWRPDGANPHPRGPTTITGTTMLVKCEGDSIGGGKSMILSSEGGHFQIHSYAGNMNIDSTSGDIEMRTSGGNIDIVATGISTGSIYMQATQSVTQISGHYSLFDPITGLTVYIGAPITLDSGGAVNISSGGVTGYLYGINVLAKGALVLRSTDSSVTIRTTNAVNVIGGAILSNSSFSSTDYNDGGYLTVGSGSTFTDSATLSFRSLWCQSYFGTTVLQATLPITTAEAATVFIAGPPSAGSFQSITSKYAFHVNDGVSLFQGPVQLAGGPVITAMNQITASATPFTMDSTSYSGTFITGSYTGTKTIFMPASSQIGGFVGSTYEFFNNSSATVNIRSYATTLIDTLLPGQAVKIILVANVGTGSWIQVGFVPATTNWSSSTLSTPSNATFSKSLTVQGPFFNTKTVLSASSVPVILSAATNTGYIFIGSYSSGQSVELPDATLFEVGTTYDFYNYSSSIVTVSSYDLTVVCTIDPGQTQQCVLTSTSSHGVWQEVLYNSTSGGTVESVAATVPDFLSISGSPITSSGTLAISYSGTALPITSGGTGATTATGSGAVVLQDNAGLNRAVVTGGGGNYQQPSLYVVSDEPTSGCLLSVFRNPTYALYTDTVMQIGVNTSNCFRMGYYLDGLGSSQNTLYILHNSGAKFSMNAATATLNVPLTVSSLIVSSETVFGGSVTYNNNVFVNDHTLTVVGTGVAINVLTPLGAPGLLNFGVNKTLNNAGFIGFEYTSSGSALNYIDIGFWGSAGSVVQISNTQMRITKSTATTSKTTGALVLQGTGGIGVGGNGYIGGNLSVDGTFLVASTSILHGATTLDDTLHVTGASTLAALTAGVTTLLATTMTTIHATDGGVLDGTYSINGLAVFFHNFILSTASSPEFEITDGGNELRFALSSGSGNYFTDAVAHSAVFKANSGKLMFGIGTSGGDAASFIVRAPGTASTTYLTGAATVNGGAGINGDLIAKGFLAGASLTTNGTNFYGFTQGSGLASWIGCGGTQSGGDFLHRFPYYYSIMGSVVTVTVTSPITYFGGFIPTTPIYLGFDSIVVYPARDQYCTVSTYNCNISGTTNPITIVTLGTSTYESTFYGANGAQALYQSAGGALLFSATITYNLV